jgi:hypothetical protein
MNAESGGRGFEGTESSEWLLRCDGMRVEGPDGFAGEVVAPLYGPSIRWDRPWGFAVRTADGIVRVPRTAVERVDLEGRVIHLHASYRD